MSAHPEKTACKAPLPSKKLKVANLQQELQVMIAQAKSDYEFKLKLNYANTNSNKNFQYISIIMGCEHFPVQVLMIMHSLTYRKFSYSTITFTLSFYLVHSQMNLIHIQVLIPKYSIF